MLSISMGSWAEFCAILEAEIDVYYLANDGSRASLNDAIKEKYNII